MWHSDSLQNTSSVLAWYEREFPRLLTNLVLPLQPLLVLLPELLLDRLVILNRLLELGLDKPNLLPFNLRIPPAPARALELLDARLEARAELAIVRDQQALASR